MVFAADLQQVEEVGGRCVNGDQVLVVFRSRIRKGLDLEVVWSLVMSIEAMVMLPLGIVP